MGAWYLSCINSNRDGETWHIKRNLKRNKPKGIDMKLFKEWIKIKTVQKELVKLAVVIGVIALAYYAWAHLPIITGSV